MTVMGGGYAEYEGVVYPCFNLSQPRIPLLLPGDAEPPEGFSRRPNGSWKRSVARSELTRLFYVTTHATWRGHQVRVERVLGATASLWSQSYPEPDDPRVVRDKLDWSADVPVDELRDVVSTIEEFPLT